MNNVNKKRLSGSDFVNLTLCLNNFSIEWSFIRMDGFISINICTTRMSINHFNASASVEISRTTWAIYREHWHTIPGGNTNFQDNLGFVNEIFFNEYEYFAYMYLCALLVCLVLVGAWRGHHIPTRHGTRNMKSCKQPSGVLGIKSGAGFCPNP